MCDKVLLLTSDAARILDMSASGVRMLVREKVLSARLTGGRRKVHLFDESEVKSLKMKRDRRVRSRRDK